MKYFTLRELTKSETAIRHGIVNSPDKRTQRNLEKLVEFILDPLREAYGKPIVVTSGYRCEKLNRILVGVKTSQHVTGEAVDIRSAYDSPEENKKIFDLIKDLNLPFDQLINEYGYDWIHVSYSKLNRRQILNIR